MKLHLLLLVLGCRLLPQLNAETSPSVPRLAGIVNVADQELAVLEISKPGYTSRWLILCAGQREGAIEVIRIKPTSSEVGLRIGGTNVQLSLPPPSDANPTSIAGGGFAMESADISPVLRLFGEWKGRWLLIWPRLPATRLTLRASTTNRTQAVEVLEKALADKGIITIPDGDKFLLIVPTSEAAAVKPGSVEIKSSTKAELIPVGAINFLNIDLNKAAQIYADCIGCKLDRTQRPPLPALIINFQNQNPLSKEECIYAMETLFRWQGVRLAPVGDGLAKIVPIPKSE